MSTTAPNVNVDLSEAVFIFPPTLSVVFHPKSHCVMYLFASAMLVISSSSYIVNAKHDSCSQVFLSFSHLNLLFSPKLPKFDDCVHSCCIHLSGLNKYSIGHFPNISQ